MLFAPFHHIMQDKNEAFSQFCQRMLHRLDKARLEYNFFYLTGISGAGRAVEGGLEKLQELKTLIERLEIPVYFATLGASNAIGVQGMLPKDKKALIPQLEKACNPQNEAELRRYRTQLRYL